MIPRADKKNKENNEDQKRESMGRIASDTISLGGGEGGSGLGVVVLYSSAVVR